VCGFEKATALHFNGERVTVMQLELSGNATGVCGDNGLTRGDWTDVNARLAVGP
jgi:hypothetical protein